MDISNRSKRKMIDQLYKKAMPKKPQKAYLFVKTGVQVKAGKGKVLVDQRMKKDVRKHRMGKAGKSSSKKGRKVKAQGVNGTWKGPAKKGRKGGAKSKKMGSRD